MNNYFKDFEEFKELFGVRFFESEDGAQRSARKNKIFLDAYKTALKNKRSEDFKKIFNETCTGENHVLYEKVGRIIAYLYLKNGRTPELFDIDGVKPKIYSDKYRSDFMRGLCEDGDVQSIRYIKKEDDRVYKMKAGKFIRSILMDAGAQEIIGDSAINYICELFTQEWKAYTVEKVGNVRLNIDKDFWFIYNSDNYLPGASFGSCMSDKDNYRFYESAVDASAASILNEEGHILARCVIFNDVKDEDGKNLRVAERQYGVNDMYKQLLVEKLIKEGRIDAYKRVGASCHDANDFVRIDGGESVRFSIKCYLENGDYISYQDSFKYFYKDLEEAFNYICDDEYFDLATTDGEYEEYRNYDEVEDEYTNEPLVEVHIWNGCDYDTLMTAEHRLDNYYYSEYTDEYYDNAVYSDILSDYLPLDRADDIEDEWKEEHWEYDSINEEYVPSVICVNIWNSMSGEYVEETDNEDNASEYYEYDGEYYDEVNQDGIPFDKVEEYENAD